MFTTQISTQLETLYSLAFVRGIILGLATAHKRPITYIELANVIGGGARNLGPLLGDLVKHDQDNGKPFVSALVVNAQTKRPGAGFHTALATHTKFKGDRAGIDRELYNLYVWLYCIEEFPFLKNYVESLGYEPMHRGDEKDAALVRAHFEQLLNLKVKL